MITLFVGLAVGLILGLTGAGGSVFAVPMILFLMQLPLPQAIGLSLGAVAVSAAFGVIMRARSGHIIWPVSAVFAILGAPLSPLGVWLNQQLPPSLVLTAFSILVIIIAINLWRQPASHPVRAELPADASPGVEQTPSRLNNFLQRSGLTGKKLLALVFGAMTTGLLSGLFGVGGGFLIVPMLLRGLQFTVTQAVASSLAIIAAISSSAFISFLCSGERVETQLLLLIGLGGLSGMLLGIAISRRIAGPTLQKIFAVMMIAVAFITLAKAL